MPDLFGLAVSPYDLKPWQDATGILPDFCMTFEAWSKYRPLTDMLAKARSFGHNWFALTWEPWTPIPIGTPSAEQGELQEQWSHDAILGGKHDDYIDTVARNLRDSGMVVYLRLMHEMNGNWYPWHNEPAQFVDVWKYIRYRMRSCRGAWNVKFVWSPNPDIWRQSPADWAQRLLPYWPGPKAVEYVGFTMLSFGNDRAYTVADFAGRFELARTLFQKEILAMEMNVAHEMAPAWLHDLTKYVRSGNNLLPAVVLSQGPSRAAATGDTGTMDWNAMDDTTCRPAIRELVAALHGD
ncbi:mannanase [Caudovirales GX15bay]|nr:mannanase [Caudovirales GX15bay]